MARLNFDELNSIVRYSIFSAFRVQAGLLGHDRTEAIEDAQRFFASSASADVILRGIYDVAGLRADADFLIWSHSEHLEELQRWYSTFRRTTVVGRASTPIWSTVALHRPAEFNKSHVPSFIAGEDPGDYICVYPFVRSFEWYLLPDTDRRRMLADHGKAARSYPDVRANTIPAFALGDYEWILAFEAARMDRIVDLMRDLRATEARMHVRKETPFFSGPRIEVQQLVSALP